MKIVYKLNNEQIQQLHNMFKEEWWTKNRSLSDTNKGVKNSDVIIGLVNSNGELVAFVRVLTDFIFKAVIFDLIVNKEFRKCNFGSELISLVKNHALLHEVKHFELYCLPEIREFYKKHDFGNELQGIELMRHIK